MFLDFEIDKLTHSLEDVTSGDIFLTEVLYGQYMELDTNASIKLINNYFPEFFNK